MSGRITSVDEIDVREDLWQTLAASDKPVVLYGMGNGADKILDAFAERGVECADFFASDAFVRGQSFHGKTVLTYAQVCEKYEDFTVAVSFGTRLPDVLAAIYSLDEKRELVVPDVPVVPDADGLFDLAYFNAHRAELSRVCALLADERSKETFCDIILYRLTGKLAYLCRHTVRPDEVYKELLHAEKIRYAADLGAYTGDSIRELAAFAPELSSVTAFEPDARNFKKLTEFAGTVPYRIDAVNAAAWDRAEELSFTSGGNRNSTALSADALKAGAKVKTVRAARLDENHEGPCDYIKYDVEGAEREALEGSRGLIERTHPKLLVSLYHRTGDLIRLPELVRSMGYGRLYIRRFEYVPAWDLDLIAAE